MVHGFGLALVVCLCMYVCVMQISIGMTRYKGHGTCAYSATPSRLHAIVTDTSNSFALVQTNQSQSPALWGLSVPAAWLPLCLSHYQGKIIEQILRIDII